MSLRRLFYSICLTAIIFTPFIHHHATAYIRYCVPCSDDNCNAPFKASPWCLNMPPSIYTYVQSKYWDAGFLRYWTLQQLPNFLISLPLFSLLLTFTIHHIANSLIPRLRLLTSPKSSPFAYKAASPFLSPNITPHAVHALLLTLTILLTSNVQIILRLAASMPCTYWAAAWLVYDVRNKLWMWLWIGYSVVWGQVSMVLWAAFLPPA